MNHHPITCASSADRVYVTHAIHENNQVNGLFYALDGYHNNGGKTHSLTVFVTLGVTREEMDDAVLTIKLEKEISESTVLMVPEAWIDQAEAYYQELLQEQHDDYVTDLRRDAA